MHYCSATFRSLASAHRAWHCGHRARLGSDLAIAAIRAIASFQAGESRRSHSRQADTSDAPR